MRSLLLLLLVVSQLVSARVSGTNLHIQNNHNSPDTTNRVTSKSPILVPEISYTGDLGANLRGGVNSGAFYLGMLSGQISLDMEKARLLKGGKLRVKAVNLHATKSPSELLGDMQVASNIDAGNHTYFQELWISKSFPRLEVIAGLQDLNMEFAASEYGGLFLNSSFGILPVISTNIAAPIFPLTTLGITIKYELASSLKWLFALHDGCPIDFDKNPYNLRWGYHIGDGLLTVSELQYSTMVGKYEGTYKLGVFSKNNLVDRSLRGEIPDSLNCNVHGLYFYADQLLFERGDRSIAAFTQMGYSPSKASVNDVYIGGGINYTGLFSKSNRDITGIAIGYQKLTGSLSYETVAEFTMKYSISDIATIQPDIQYIINPSGTDTDLKNALGVFLRLGITL